MSRAAKQPAVTCGFHNWLIRAFPFWALSIYSYVHASTSSFCIKCSTLWTSWDSIYGPITATARALWIFCARDLGLSGPHVLSKHGTGSSFHHLFGCSGVQQPAEDAFAAIAQEALRFSPKSPKGPKPRGERGRTLSEGGEKAANESATTEDARAPFLSLGPQGGLGTLYPTVDAGVPGVAVKEGPHVAVETLPGLSRQLPPLPEAPVAFEPKLGHEVSPVEAGPAKPLHPPVVVDTSSATPGTQQGGSPPAEWDAFFADR
jgi:hypothetical protein